MGAAERDEWLRAAWRVPLAQRIDPQRLAFVDEMGANYFAFSALRLFAEGTKGVLLDPAQPRAEHDVALMRMGVEGMGPSLAVEGATDREVFEAYVQRVLSPQLCVPVRSW